MTIDDSKFRVVLDAYKALVKRVCICANSAQEAETNPDCPAHGTEARRVNEEIQARHG